MYLLSKLIGIVNNKANKLYNQFNHNYEIITEQLTILLLQYKNHRI